MAKRSKQGKRSPPKTRKARKKEQQAAAFRSRRKKVTEASEQADDVLSHPETATEPGDPGDTVGHD